MERMMDSGDQPAKRGRSVGRQMAIIPTPSSTMPQKSRTETTPMSSVARRPATRALARTVRTGESVSSRKMEEWSRERLGERNGRAELTRGCEYFDKNDHTGDAASYSPMDHQLGSASLHFSVEGEGAHSAPTRMAPVTANFLRSGICSLNIYLLVS